ncbi:MAG: L,D-transpeptidase [Phycisphaerae bacterium]|nr:L,D-transpeptidase [Phycisphaerae bacterium]
MAFLTEQGWEEYVGDKVGVWVCSERQILYVVEQGRILKQYRCSTGLAGMGNVRNSGMTPVGWHTIESKIGGELAAGAVMKGRRWTGEVWQEGMTSDGDLILSRIMWLKGLEAGRNLGGDVDSWGRYIYIHGTNDVAGLGEPKSHGCVRLDPHEVIDLFGRVEEGCRVLITDTDETN